MKNLTSQLLVLAAIALNSTTALAHHSAAATFDMDSTTSAEGVVTNYRFTNPHVILFLDVSDAEGAVTNWMTVGTSATTWRRFGWDNKSLSTGDVVRVSGPATHDGTPAIWINQIEMLDSDTRSVVAVLNPGEDPAASLGRTAAADNDAPDAAPGITMIPLTLPSGEPNFTGTTARNNSLAARGGPDANDPPLPYNEVGQAALEAWDVANDPQVFCDPPGVVRQAGYTPYGQIIAQYPDHVTIEYEEYGTRRAVFFDDELPKPGVRSHMGDSVARYEGDSLIIETVNLAANASGHRGRPISDKARVTEVYTRVDDPQYGSAVKTETTVVDSEYLTEPWTISRTKVYTEGYEFIENDCVPPLRERPANVWQE